MIPEYDLEVVAGDDLIQAFRVLDQDDALVDFSGHAFECPLGRSEDLADATLLALIDTTTVTLMLPHEATAHLSGQYDYRVIHIGPAGSRRTLFRGLLTVESN
jgi:hypothetical protein